MPHGSTGVGLVVLAGAYLIGSVPVAWLLGRFSGGFDLRDVGSRNPGTSNLFRNAGVRLAMVSGPLQFGQGVLAVMVARGSGGDGGFLGLAAIAGVVGNGWPIWFRFHGQRAIAVATGAVAALHPALLLVLLTCFAAGALLHAIALGVLSGFSLLPLAAIWIGKGVLAVPCLALLGLVVLRRLEGLGGDLRAAQDSHDRRVLLRRLLFDERPGQVLVGRTDSAVPLNDP